MRGDSEVPRRVASSFVPLLHKNCSLSLHHSNNNLGPPRTQVTIIYKHFYPFVEEFLAFMNPFLAQSTQLVI